MSDFIISGFTESRISLPSVPMPPDVRRTELCQQAYVELARFEFGVVDVQQHRSTDAAMRLMAARRRVDELDHARAKQRARAYAPAEGHEHCPHCWVYTGIKRTLRFRDGARLETASCAECAMQFQLVKT